MIKGIDVSSWQGNIDFGKVKASGIDFVIIRAGYGREVSQIDKNPDLQVGHRLLKNGIFT